MHVAIIKVDAPRNYFSGSNRNGNVDILELAKYMRKQLKWKVSLRESYDVDKLHKYDKLYIFPGLNINEPFQQYIETIEIPYVLCLNDHRLQWTGKGNRWNTLTLDDLDILPVLNIKPKRNKKLYNVVTSTNVTGYNRLRLINTLLDKVTNVKVYGNETIYCKPEDKRPYHCGQLDYKDYMTELSKARFSVVAPSETNTTTAKWAEAVAMGTLPLFTTQYKLLHIWQSNLIVRDTIDVNTVINNYTKKKYYEKLKEGQALLRKLQHAFRYKL